MKLQSRLISAGVVGAFILWTGCAVAYADCLPSARNIGFPDGSAQVRTYICRLDDMDGPSVEVEFDRLSETAAGNLVENTPYPDLSQVFGSPVILHNAVYSEVKNLFDSYGTRQLTSTCYVFAVTGAVPALANYVNDKKNQHCGDKRVLWYLWFPDQENLTTVQMPLLNEEHTYITSTRWPEGWNFFYRPIGQDCGPPWVTCTTIWRPAQKSDLMEYWNDLKKDRTRMAAESHISVTEMEDAQRKDDNKIKKYFSLVMHLNGDAWQDGFLTLTGTPPTCGGGIVFELHTRELILETALIKNISDRPLSLDGLVGSTNSATELRDTSSTGPSGSDGIVATPSTMLAPGTSIVVPLRILFVPEGGADHIFQNSYASDTPPIDRAAAVRTYKSIMAARPGTIFKFDDPDAKPGTGHIRKLRESFGAPSVPNLPNYAYGPAFNLSGLMIGGQRLDFNAVARNFFKIAAGDSYGSCPYLYAFDDDADAWVWLGKVIHNAHSANLETTQRVDFPGLVTRFSIREEELEISHIRHVELDLLLNDDRVERVTSSVFMSYKGPDGYAVINAGEGQEFAFVLPAGISRADVKRSTLVVTGYYDPYSTLALMRRGE